MQDIKICFTNLRNSGLTNAFKINIKFEKRDICPLNMEIYRLS